MSDFKKERLAHKIINNKNIPSKEAAKIEEIDFKTEAQKEHAVMTKEAFVELMVQRSAHKIPIGNGNEPPTKNRVWRYVTQREFECFTVVSPTGKSPSPFRTRRGPQTFPSL